jgi:hypothetical protein
VEVGRITREPDDLADLPEEVLAAVRAVPDVRPEAVARGRARLVVGPVRSDAVGEAMWNEGREALQGLH